MTRKPSHAHLKQGWTYSPYVGASGGWELPVGTVHRMAVRDGRRWVAYVVRHRDGATLHSSYQPTRADAMRVAAEWKV